MAPQKDLYCLKFLKKYFSDVSDSVHILYGSVKLKRVVSKRFKTRIHSSRMRTVRFNGNLHMRGWECLPRGVCSGGPRDRHCPADREVDTSWAQRQTPPAPLVRPLAPLPAGNTYPLSIACFDTQPL